MMQCYMVSNAKFAKLVIEISRNLVIYDIRCDSIWYPYFQELWS